MNVLKARDDITKANCVGVYKEEKKINEQFGRRMNGDVEGNRKLFWMEARKAKRENKELLQKIVDVNGVCVSDETEEMEGILSESA